MALTTGDLAQLKAAYENMNVYNTPMVDNMSVYENVAPLNVNVPSGLQTIDIQPATEIQPVTQSNGLDYLLNQEGGQNQNFTMKEYEKALANQNAKPQSNYFLSGIFAYVMDNKYVQGARNIGSMITDPFMGGLSYLAQKADKFSSLPYVNQQFIKENMGYTGPTVSGENTSGLSTDPFGINTRSLRGDYAEYVQKRYEELNESLEESKKDWEEKFGSLNAIDPRYNKTWAEMNKMNLSGQKYYGNKYSDFSKKKQAYDKSIELKEIEREKNKIIAQMQAQQAKAKSDEDLANIQAIQKDTGKPLSTYRMDRPASERQFTGAAPKGTTTFDTKSGMGRRDYAQGGRIRYGTGGIVTL